MSSQAVLIGDQVSTKGYSAVFVYYSIIHVVFLQTYPRPRLHTVGRLPHTDRLLHSSSAYWLGVELHLLRTRKQNVSLHLQRIPQLFCILAFRQLAVFDCLSYFICHSK